jgi:sorbitol-specific phosphotransferase system component IIA
MAAEAKRLDDNALQIAQALIAQVGKKISDAIERERQGTFTGLSAAELRELSHVTGNAQKIGKLALGEAQEISKVSADVTAPESYIALVEELDRLAERKASLGKHTIQ